MWQLTELTEEKCRLQMQIQNNNDDERKTAGAAAGYHERALEGAEACVQRAYDLEVTERGAMAWCGSSSGTRPRARPWREQAALDGVPQSKRGRKRRSPRAAVVLTLGWIGVDRRRGGRRRRAGDGGRRRP